LEAFDFRQQLADFGDRTVVMASGFPAAVVMGATIERGGYAGLWRRDRRGARGNQ
jgi:hypothetical protein